MTSRVVSAVWGLTISLAMAWSEPGASRPQLSKKRRRADFTGLACTKRLSRETWRDLEQGRESSADGKVNGLFPMSRPSRGPGGGSIAQK